MLSYSLIAFGLSALGGLILAAHVLRGKFAPWALSLLHAGFGALGLAFLILLMLEGATSQIIPIGLVLLAVAAVIGFFLASLHLRKRLPPNLVVAFHAGFALVGFLTILSQVL
jgi:hypothetical protein